MDLTPAFDEIDRATTVEEVFQAALHFSDNYFKQDASKRKIKGVVKLWRLEWVSAWLPISLSYAKEMMKKELKACVDDETYPDGVNVDLEVDYTYEFTPEQVQNYIYSGAEDTSVTNPGGYHTGEAQQAFYFVQFHLANGNPSMAREFAKNIATSTHVIDLLNDKERLKMLRPDDIVDMHDIYAVSNMLAGNHAEAKNIFNRFLAGEDPSKQAWHVPFSYFICLARRNFMKLTEFFNKINKYEEYLGYHFLNGDDDVEGQIAMIDPNFPPFAQPRQKVNTLIEIFSFSKFIVLGETDRARKIALIYRKKIRETGFTGMFDTKEFKYITLLVMRDILLETEGREDLILLEKGFYY
ncbi:MAG: hypothetical protein ACFFCS_07355 [Candidatus Hodarchaeota archaeon]